MKDRVKGFVKDMLKTLGLMMFWTVVSFFHWQQ